jgi:transposase
MSPKRRKPKRGRGGRPPVLTEQQKKQIRKIAQQEIEMAFRRMLGSFGVHRGSRKP